MKKQRIRILMVRLGMDAHWRGSIVVARALRDAGMEVIYGGNQMPANIVKMALQEDVDIIGLSSLSGNHLMLAPEVVKLLKKEKAQDIKVIFGGTVPPDDVPILKKAGIAAVFGPGSSLQKIIASVEALKRNY
ncbi:MAG TPA: cobalamin B12-binding domain-containing protein [Syntrophales bacterium]|nr:cobalamin B12-binding domain-containing protein [Syntrophales bacterium]HOG91805.1 cobalamin B12-binding domain-containing protein [Smithella sp.]HPN08619.1 cobalamin B12-binding domain-containing protein [Syntrophales bacterium]HPX80778.1 cobalamin B12-binding domain-containing protein [Syntrophales bacterium]HQB14628.1 cobalamin B12-binding domain-containing protein [Syntrophales bacterium]